MVRWVKSLAAIANSIFLFAFSLYGHPGIPIVGGMINLIWAFDEKLSPGIRRFLRPWVFVINTAFSAYGVLAGALPILALFLVGSSLLSWNAGLFLERWGDAPRAVQNRYLRLVGSLIMFGLFAGLSALALQGRVTLRFFPALLLTLAAGILWLRVISEALKSKKSG